MKAAGSQCVDHVLIDHPVIVVVVLVLQMLIEFLALINLLAISSKLVNTDIGSLSLLTNANSVIATTTAIIQLLHTKSQNLESFKFLQVNSSKNMQRRAQDSNKRLIELRLSWKDSVTISTNIWKSRSHVLSNYRRSLLSPLTWTSLQPFNWW